MADSKQATAADLLAHSGWLRGLANNLVGDTWQADDLIQQIWVAALRKPPTVDRSLRPWLAQVARNFARDYRRRQGARQERLVEDSTLELFEDLDGQLPVEAGAELKESRVALVEAVLGLHEPYRAVIMLRFYGDLQPIEIARRQGISSATVRTRLRRGLLQLREKLGGQFDSDEIALQAMAGLAISGGAGWMQFGLPALTAGAASVGTGASAGTVTGWLSAHTPTWMTGPMFLWGSLLGLLGLTVALSVMATDGLERESELAGDFSENTLVEEPESPTLALQQPEEVDRAAVLLAADSTRGSRRKRQEPERVEPQLEEDEEPEPWTIFGSVTRNGVPLVGALVRSAPGRRVSFTEESDYFPDEYVSGVTDSKGEFLLHVEELGEYVVACALEQREGSRVNYARAVLREERNWARVNFKIGDSAILGQLYNENGKALGRASLRVARVNIGANGRPKGYAEQVWVHSNDRGGYRLDGLRPGTYWIGLKLDNEGHEWRFHAERMVELGAREEQRCDFGGGEWGDLDLTIHLDGEPWEIFPQGSLILKGVSRGDVGSAELNGWEYPIELDRAGRVSAKLAAGSYSVTWRARGGLRQHDLEVGSILVSRQATRHTIDFPAVALHGQVQVDGQMVDIQSMRELTVLLQRAPGLAGSAVGGAPQRCKIGERGSFVFGDLEPGHYLLGLELGEKNIRARSGLIWEVVVEGSDRLVLMDLEWSPGLR